ncbi:hypothetical protein PS723_06491 [Pseudomonas fluorescens]|uniref:Uncharacterized protein n=1 Tax=Pseudomonas fluorescens TaxID=294 RepID=A0A5E7G007_PSEFL|nr:hypothetical protein PS723_06491 [Pseudomonas fluorescens]
MTDAGASRAQASDFIRVEMNAMGQPGTRPEPADAVQIIHGAQAETLQAEVFFVEGFGEMGVQAHVELVGQFRTGRHDLWGNGKRRAGRQGNLDLRAIATFVVFGDQALAVGENHFTLLHGLLRRQPAVGFTQTHRAAGEHRAHAQFAHALDLYINGVFQTFGEQVVVIGRGGAARQQQLGQSDFARQCQFLRGQSSPDRIQGFQPGE